MTEKYMTPLGPADINDGTIPEGDVGILVCVSAEFESPYHDNIRTECHRCGAAVQHRPHQPSHLKPTCYSCVTDLMAENEEFKICVTPKTAEEVEKILNKMKN